MSTEKVRWDEFDKMHVVKKLREIIGSWWQVQINFTDKKGFLRGVPEGKFFNPINPICKAIVADDTGFSKRIATARQTTVDAMTRAEPKIARDVSGFSVISVPIRVNNEFIGAVFGDGFIVEETANEQKAQIKAYLEKDFSSRSDLAEKVDSLPVMTSQEIEYLTQLITLVVDEILLIHKFLDEEKTKAYQPDS